MNEDLAVEILKMVRGIDKKLDDSIIRLNAHVNKEEGDWDEMKASLDSLALAFPNGDTSGHASYHTNIMQIMEDRKAFWKKMRENTATWGILGLLGWMAIALWHAFLQGPVK